MELNLTVTERMWAHKPIHALGGRCNPAMVRLAVAVLDILEFTEEEQALYGIRLVEGVNSQGRAFSRTVWDPEHADAVTTIEMKPAQVKWLAQQILSFTGWDPERTQMALFDKMEAAKDQVEEEYGQMETEANEAIT